jgi:uncharacterized protein (DUF2141 family)
MRAIVTALLMLAVTESAASAGDLTVTIDGVDNANGSVLGALYANESTFLNPASAAQRFKVKAATGAIVYVFHNVGSGRYALSVFHDANDNGHLDRNDLGVPVEGYGFSNDALGSGGPPKFQQAAFDFDGKAQAITIELNY